MAPSLKHWRIAGATLFSVVVVIASYLTVHNIQSPDHASASAEGDLLKAIAAKDTDRDGLADWEESLYGTDPKNPDTRGLGMTDSEAIQKGLIVPKALAEITSATSTEMQNLADPNLPAAPADGSLTATFSQNFFTRYLATVKNSADGNLSEADLKKIATDSLAELAASVVKSPDYKSARDLKISESGVEAFKAYAADAEAAVASQHHTATKSEVFYLQDLANSDSKDAIVQMASIAKAYRMSAASLSAVTVPKDLATAHLNLINAFARLGALVDDFTRLDSDPLVTMMALQQYPDAVLRLGNTLIAVGNAYKRAGIVLSADEKGATFVNMMTTIAAEQKSGKNL